MLRKLAFTIAVLTSAVIMITEIFNPAFRESHPIASVLGGGLYGCTSVSPSSEIIVRRHHPTSTAPHQDAVYGWRPGSSLLKNMQPVVAMMDQQPTIQGTLQFEKGRYGVTESGSLQLITRATGGLLPFPVENMFNEAINKWGLPNLIENGELVIEYEDSDIPGVVVQFASTYNIPHTDIGNKQELILNQQESGTFSIPLKTFYDGYPGKSGWFLSLNQLPIVLFVYYDPNTKFPGSPEIVNEQARRLTEQKNPFFILPQAPVPGNKFQIKGISLQLRRPGLS